MNSLFQLFWPSVPLSQESRPLLRQSSNRMVALALGLFGMTCVIWLICVGLVLLGGHVQQINQALNYGFLFLMYLDLFWLKNWVPFYVLTGLAVFAMCSYVRLQLGLYEIAKKPVLTSDDVNLSQKLKRLVLVDLWGGVLTSWCFLFVGVALIGFLAGEELGTTVDPNISFVSRRYSMIAFATVCWVLAKCRFLLLPHEVADGAEKDINHFVYWAHQVTRRFEHQESELRAKNASEPEPVKSESLNVDTDTLWLT